MKFNLSHKQTLPEISSASGIVLLEEHFYIIGDDAPWLFKLDKNFSILKKIPLLAELDGIKEIIPKKDKPDFEAITVDHTQQKKFILIFGSGSKSPQRDVFIKVGISTEEVFTYSLGKFYERLRSSSNTALADFNIEAATIVNDHLLLFNRGNNFVFEISLEEFYASLEEESEAFSVETHQINLPRPNNMVAGFSAASFISAEEKILFTATVEDTTNWYDDGEVMGSYIGFLDLKNLGHELQPQLIPVSEEDNILKLKVEGICFTNISSEAIEITMVTDSDGGVSEVLQGTISR